MNHMLKQEDWYKTCANCGFRYGLHRASDDKCPNHQYPPHGYAETATSWEKVIPCDPPSPPAPTLLDEAMAFIRAEFDGVAKDFGLEVAKLLMPEQFALLHRYDSGER